MTFTLGEKAKNAFKKNTIAILIRTSPFVQKIMAIMQRSAGSALRKLKGFAWLPSTIRILKDEERKSPVFEHFRAASPAGLLLGGCVVTKSMSPVESRQRVSGKNL